MNRADTLVRTRAASAPARTERGNEVPASEREGGAAGAKPPGLIFEPERYELTAPPRFRFEPLDVNRREFLRIFGVVGAGVLVVTSTPVTVDAQQESGRGQGGRELPTELEAWIHVDGRGHVTAFTGKVEIGQNIRTSLSQVISDELAVPIEWSIVFTRECPTPAPPA